MTQQNAALVEEAAAASESMDDQAKTLNEMMNFFETGEVASEVVVQASPKATSPAAAPRPVRVKPDTATPAKAPVTASDDSAWEEF